MWSTRNGRTLRIKLQFGHGCGAVEMHQTARPGRRGVPASIRPRLRSRGDTYFVPAVTFSVRSGFNSATAAEPWRYTGRGLVRLAVCLASIRPRLRSRGDSHRMARHYGGRNYASIRPRLRSRGDCDKWAGPRSGGMEASIRPRLRSRGDCIKRFAHRLGLLTLQFGHGCGAVEI